MIQVVVVLQWDTNISEDLAAIIIRCHSLEDRNLNNYVIKIIIRFKIMAAQLTV